MNKPEPTMMNRRQFIKSAGTVALGVMAASGAGLFNPFQANAQISEIGRRFNVKSYGASGNGVTDDTEAIQNAIHAAGTSGSPKEQAIVFFPDGIYKVSALAVPYYHVVLIVESMEGTRILMSADRTNGVTFSDIGSTRYFHVEVEGLQFLHSHNG